jgi:rhodanese-related sulfurtransferase
MTSTTLNVPRISPSKAQQIQSSALLLDVRTPAEFEEAHIAGSVLHPLSSLNLNEVEKLAAGKSGCVVVCKSGNRAVQAAEKLKASRLPGLSVLEGGVTAWEAAGLPLERGQKTMSLDRQVRISSGGLVLTGIILAHFVNPWFVAISVFIGAGTVYAGISDTCGMGMLLAQMPWNNRTRSTAKFSKHSVLQ